MVGVRISENSLEAQILQFFGPFYHHLHLIGDDRNQNTCGNTSKIPSIKLIFVTCELTAVAYTV